VLYERGEDAAGLAWLDSWLPTYPRDGLMHCHISWYVAMFALVLGDGARAWRIYREQVHPGGAWGPALNVATDAPAFLWRSELAGHKRDQVLWRQLNDYVRTAFPRPGVAFVEVHRVLSAVAAGDRAGLESYAAEIEERVAAGKAPSGDIVPRLARGLAAYGAEDWEGTIAELEPALAQTVRIGGSRAQRDVVENTLIAAYLKAGRQAEARQRIAAHTDRRPSVPVAGL